MQADWLFLLTDVTALYTANPNTDPSARPIHEVHDIAGLEVCHRWRRKQHICIAFQAACTAEHSQSHTAMSLAIS